MQNELQVEDWHRFEQPSVSMNFLATTLPTQKYLCLAVGYCDVQHWDYVYVKSDVAWPVKSCQMSIKVAQKWFH